MTTKLLTKVITIIIALTAALFAKDGGATQDFQNDVHEHVHEQGQMMEINCIHCHKNITIDISADSAICTFCGETNEFSG